MTNFNAYNLHSELLESLVLEQEETLFVLRADIAEDHFREPRLSV